MTETTFDNFIALSKGFRIGALLGLVPNLPPVSTSSKFIRLVNHGNAVRIIGLPVFAGGIVGAAVAWPLRHYLVDRSATSSDVHVSSAELADVGPLGKKRDRDTWGLFASKNFSTPIYECGSDFERDFFLEQQAESQ